MWQIFPFRGLTLYTSEFCSQLTKISVSSNSFPDVFPLCHSSFREVLHSTSLCSLIDSSIACSLVYAKRITSSVSAFWTATGIPTLIRIGSFGFVAQTSYIHPDLGLPITVTNDNSFMLLLNMIIFIILAGIFLFLWYAQLNDSMNLQNLNSIGKKKTSKELVKSLVGKNYHLLLLAFPTAGLIIFTIVPLIFMILVAFTNYSSSYQSPKELFDWVGVYNFKKLFGMGSNSYEFSYVFGQVLLWTLIWAFFATFTNYFLGMIVAIIINRKGIKGKKVWRTILITTIAVPQFISLLFLSKFLNKDQGALNFMLKSMGLITQNIPFLEDALMGKITIIIVNMWIGIPYTMLMCSGLLMNIPQERYESAKIDGASPFKVYTEKKGQMNCMPK